jgi:hypothetical protein
MTNCDRMAEPVGLDGRAVLHRRFRSLNNGEGRQGSKEGVSYESAVRAWHGPFLRDVLVRT